MIFQPLTLGEIPMVRPYFSLVNPRTCDFTVGGMFMWRGFWHMEYALCHETFYSRLYDGQGQVFYNLPLSQDLSGALAALIREVAGPDGLVRFCTIPASHLSLFQENFRLVQVVEERNYFDYLYRAEDLVHLRGKPYSGQRNLIRQFCRAQEQWAFEPLTDDNLPQVLDFFLRDYSAHPDASPSEQEENQRVLEVLHHLSLYQMHGGVLTAEGQVVGFSLGETVRDTLFTHIEKADRTCKGAYQMLVNQFAARYAGEGISYINREEDMGDPGLRRAKLAYHPVELLQKYTVGVRAL